MQIKFVVKLHINHEKCRSKAMQLAAATQGVHSVEITGDDRDQLVVVGENVDPVKLTTTLRRKVGNARILNANEVQNPVAEPTTPQTSNPEPPAPIIMPYYAPPPVFARYQYDDPMNCHIM